MREAPGPIVARRWTVAEDRLPQPFLNAWRRRVIVVLQSGQHQGDEAVGKLLGGVLGGLPPAAISTRRHTGSR